MDALKLLLESQLLFTLFLTIALGYLVGEINLKGFSLGSGAVLFVGLTIGGFAPKAAPPALLGTLGLLLFLYGVGIQYGGQFFKGLTSKEGVKANIAAALGVIAAAAVSLALIPLIGVKADQALGLFAGAGTSTSALQAILVAFGSDGAAIGYSIAYPFGVAGPILSIYLLNLWLKPKIEAPAAQRIEVAEVCLQNVAFVGLRLGQLATQLPAGVVIAAVRRNAHNRLPSEQLVLQENDILLATATNKAELDTVIQLVGQLQPGSVYNDRNDLDYIRVFVSKRSIVGCSIGDLQLPKGIACSIAQVRRGDSDLLPSPDLILEVGDRVGLLVQAGGSQAMRQFFGDSIKGTADFSYISIGIGAALGLLIGLIPLPIPGVGKMTLGLAGLLLLALYLGKIRRTGALVWSMPLSANLVLRNFGLTIFLAQVGLSSGPKFFATVSESGISSLMYGAIILLTLVLVTALVSLWVFRLPFDTAIGVIAGATGNPAIIAFASRIAPTDRPDVGYAMIFPSMTIFKILLVQIAAVFLR